MRKKNKLYALLGVLLVLCIAVVVVNNHEEKKEQIKNSGEVILEISKDDVNALSWTNESGTFSFTKDEKWTYDDDAAFPVDEDKINDLLEQFESLGAAFVIDDVEDYSLYGLDDPICTIIIVTDEESYTIELGDYSKMDEQRYASIGDGKAYLLTHDPLEEYDVVLKDMILDDEIVEFETDDVKQIEFSGLENYTIIKDEDKKSICEDDVYFTGDSPLDSDNVSSYIRKIKSLSLGDYVSYNVTDEELAAYGLDNPELIVKLEYSNDETEDGELKLSISRNVEELEAYNKAKENEEEDLPEVTCYIRVNDSQIIYEITQDKYDELTAVSYDTLRHQELFTADFDTVTSIDVSLNGESYTFNCEKAKDDDEEDKWTYNEEEIDTSALETTICAIEADSFINEATITQEEISLTIHLDNEDFPSFELTLYRFDGTNCVAYVDGKVSAYVARSEVVDLIEAVNKIILGA